MKRKMKKCGFILLVVYVTIVSLLCLSSCNDKKLSGYVRIQINDEKNCLIVDSSASNGYYIPGTVLNFYANPIMDEDLCMYVNGEYYASQRSINTGNGFIWEYIFTVPDYDVIIDFKIGSSIYATLNSVIQIPLEALDNIVKVRFEQGYIGVAPGNLTHIEYTTNQSDIDNVVKILNMPIRNANEEESQVCGGGYVRYSFFTENDRYDIYLSNSSILVGDKTYMFRGNYPLIKNIDHEANSFITYQDYFKAYKTNGDIIGEYDGLSKYEFTKCDIEDLESNVKLGYIETEFGNLYIYNEGMFLIEYDDNTEYFSIVGEKNFDSIFQSCETL